MFSNVRRYLIVGVGLKIDASPLLFCIGFYYSLSLIAKAWGQFIGYALTVYCQAAENIRFFINWLMFFLRRWRE